MALKYLTSIMGLDVGDSDFLDGWMGSAWQMTGQNQSPLEAARQRIFFFTKPL
jgi:hypothetical protein